MKTLKAIKPAGGGFLKKYELHYDADGQPVCWEVISLNELKTAADLASRKTAVEIIARFEDGDYLLCREFRFAVNDYVWEFPTGIIEGNETPQQAAARELKEETGLELVKTDRILPSACYAVGLTDEIIVPIFVTVRGTMRPCDEAYEEITSHKMSLRQIDQLLRQDGVKITETCMLILAMLTQQS
ncbi:MAG: NUDIX hydrolase [Clostridia bacterium]|nr:NUDIX hydrolase [Clostridia bacterium]